VEVVEATAAGVVATEVEVVGAEGAGAATEDKPDLPGAGWRV